MNLSPLFISFKIAACSLLITFFLGIFIAYKMYLYKGRFKTVLDSILNLPIVLPPIVTGFFLLLLLGKHGFVGILLSKLDINIIFSWQSAVIASIIITCPLMYRSVLSSLLHIDVELIEVADSFGATEFQKFRYVVVPLALPGILSGAVLTFTRSLGEFGATLMVAGNIPDKTQTIPTAIYFFASGGDYNTALFWVIIIMLLSFFFMFLVNVLYPNK
ncbi:MAG: molybdate ABC transporter permease subunit [Cellulosilyticaceae bacterium]